MQKDNRWKNRPWLRIRDQPRFKQKGNKTKISHEVKKMRKGIYAKQGTWIDQQIDRNVVYLVISKSDCHGQKVRQESAIFNWLRLPRAFAMARTVLVDRVLPHRINDWRLQSKKPVLIVSINRPERRNAVDRETAAALYEAFLAFDKDPEVHVRLTGADDRCLWPF